MLQWIWIIFCIYPLSCEGWTVGTERRTMMNMYGTKDDKISRYQYHQQQQSCRINSKLYNIPPPSENNVIEFQQYASKLSPPTSFYELQQDCTRAIRLARRDNIQLIEIEYPPLPANVLEMDDVSAYDVARANLQLAIELGKNLIISTPASSSSSSNDNDNNNKPIQKITILFPDVGETNIVIDKFLGGSNTPAPGIMIQSLRRANDNDLIDDRIFQPDQLLLGLFGRDSGGAVKPVTNTDVYICITFSAQELPDIEELYNKYYNNNITIIFFNLKLDVLRGDLGAPAFPSKQFHDRFLSKIKPIYYLRTRQYSRSTTKPPFVVNFQGCLFRSYPGEYQTLIDTGNGKYRQVVSNIIRPPLGGFKQQLIDELSKQGVVDKDDNNNSFFNFLRTGYKVTTWWEEEREDASTEWNT